MISIGFKRFTSWETQIGYAAGGPAQSRPCMIAMAMADLWDGGPHLEMDGMESMDEIGAEVVIYAGDPVAGGGAAPTGTALLYWDYFDRLKKVVGFVPVNPHFMSDLRGIDHAGWSLRLGFARGWEDLIKGDIENFEDARGHPARLVHGAAVLLAQGEGAL